MSNYYFYTDFNKNKQTLIKSRKAIRKLKSSIELELKCNEIFKTNDIYFINEYKKEITELESVIKEVKRAMYDQTVDRIGVKEFRRRLLTRKNINLIKSN